MATTRLPYEILNAMNISAGSATLTATPSLAENQLVLVLKNVFSLSFIKSYVENLFNIEKTFFSVFGLIGFGFLGIGLRQMILQKKYKILGATAVSLVPLFALALGHSGTNGYISPYLYLFIMFMSIGCYSFAEEIAGMFNFSSLKRRSLLLLFVLLSASYSSFVLFQNLFFMPVENAKPVEYQMLGAWFQDAMKDHEQQSIMARKPEIAYYAGADWFEISEEQSPAELLDLMKNNNVRFLAVDTRSMRENAARFAGENGTYTIPNTLELVKEVDYYDQKIYLYALRSATSSEKSTQSR